MTGIIFQYNIYTGYTHACILVYNSSTCIRCVRENKKQTACPRKWQCPAVFTKYYYYY